MTICKIILPIFVFVLSACAPSAEVFATQVSNALTATAAVWTKTPTSTVTFTPTETSIPTATATPSLTLTPTFTLSPTIAATPTSTVPTVIVNQQAFCRYGPAKAYLNAADLYAGDVGIVRGRFIYSDWLYVKFDKRDYSCWVAPSVVDVVGVELLSSVPYWDWDDRELRRIGSNMYGPPGNVTTIRDGNQVTITWNKVEMTLDDSRGYLLVLFVCQDGNLLWWTGANPDQDSTSYTVRDEAGCSQPSSGKLYTVEKHGFSEPAIIPWPAP